MKRAIVSTVETDRLLRRRLEPGDMGTYYRRVYADPDVMRTLPGGAPIDRAAFDARVPAFMVAHWERHGFGPWAAVHKPDGQLIGHCGLKYWPDSPDVEVFYAFARPYWGRGLATEAARASVRHGFEHLGLARIIGVAMTGNAASRRVLERAGLRFEREGEFAGLAVAFYGADRAGWHPDVTPPTPTP